MRKWIAGLVVGHCLIGPAARTETEEVVALKAFQVNLTDRVFPDRAPEAVEHAEPLSVARGGKLCLQFVLEGANRNLGTVKMAVEVSAPRGAGFAGAVRTYSLAAVPVEANSNGCSKTRVGSRPPAGHLRYLVREAPFEVYEVMVEGDEIEWQGERRHHAAVVEIAVAEDAGVGEHRGVVRLQGARESLLLRRPSHSGCIERGCRLTTRCTPSIGSTTIRSTSQQTRLVSGGVSVTGSCWRTRAGRYGSSAMTACTRPSSAHGPRVPSIHLSGRDDWGRADTPLTSRGWTAGSIRSWRLASGSFRATT